MLKVVRGTILEFVNIAIDVWEGNFGNGNFVILFAYHTDFPIREMY